MRTIAIINQKGGVGKTTTVANLGAALARAGKRVVVFDMDPQANLSLYLGSEVGRGEASVYGVLTEGLPIQAALRATNTPNLQLVASHLDLSGAELELASTLGRETLLRDALSLWIAEGPSEGPADFVLLDCPPSLGLLSINALVAADEVMIAVQTEFFALQGLSKLVEVIQLLRRRMNPGLTLSGIIPCLYDSRLKLGREVLAELRRFFPDKVFRHPIRTNVRLAESPSHGQTIFEYAPDSNGALDYARLAEEILKRPAPPGTFKPSPVTVVADEQALELKRAAEGLKTLEPSSFADSRSEIDASGEFASEMEDPTDRETPDSVDAPEPPQAFESEMKEAPGQHEEPSHGPARKNSDGVDAELAAYEIPRTNHLGAQLEPKKHPLELPLGQERPQVGPIEGLSQMLPRMARQPALGSNDSRRLVAIETEVAVDLDIEVEPELDENLLQELASKTQPEPMVLEPRMDDLEAPSEAERTPASDPVESLPEIPEPEPKPATPIFGFGAYIGEDRWTQRPKHPN